MVVKRIVLLVAGTGAVIATLVLARHYSLNRFTSVPPRYVPGPNETVVCSRDMDWPGYEYLYPLFKHTYIRLLDNDNGTVRNFGYQFCGHENPSCPDRFGSEVLPDRPIRPRARDVSRHQCWLASKDITVKRCVMANADGLAGSYKYPNERVAILFNTCARFVDTLITKCDNNGGGDPA